MFMLKFKISACRTICSIIQCGERSVVSSSNNVIIQRNLIVKSIFIIYYCSSVACSTHAQHPPALNVYNNSNNKNS